MARTGMLARAVDWVWTLFAAVLIAAAAIVAAVRLLLPELDTQRAAIETWLTATTGRPAVVGRIDASWSGWAPQIRVERLALLDPARREELIHFDRAVINVAPLGSLLGQGFKPQSIALSGVAFTVIRHADGHFSVAGMPPPKSPVLQWLLGQDDFAVTDAELTVIDERGGASFALSGVRLNIRNRGPRRSITAYVDLPDAIGERLVLDWSGNDSPLAAGWDGTLDVRVDGLQSGFVLSHLDWPGAPPPAVTLDVLAWSRWQDGRLNSSDVDLAVHQPTADAAQDRRGPRLLAADGLLERVAAGWRVSFGDISLGDVAAGGARPRLSLAWRTPADRPAQVVGHASDLPLATLVDLFDALRPLTARERELLTQAQPTAAIETLDFAWRSAGEAAPRYRLAARLRDFGMAAGPHWPAMHGLAGELALAPGAGQVRFDGTGFTLTDASRYAAPLAVSGVRGAVAWQMAAGQPTRLAAQALEAEVAGARLALAGTLDLVADSAPQADLRLDFSAADGRGLATLVPQGALPEKGERWLREVLVAGRVANGHARLHGPLGKLTPLADSLAMEADIEQATLRYSRNWPLADGIDGHLALDGRELAFTLASGRILGADVSGATITVPDLFVRQRMVHISGTAHGPAQSATDIVMASPLKAGRAARLQELAIDGDIAVTLDIDLALYPDGPREVLGQAQFDGNRISAPAQRVTLDDVVGTVGFTRGDWYGEGLTANFDGTPVGLVVNGGLDDPNYDSEFRMTGTSSTAGIARHLERYLPAAHRWLVTHDRLGALQGELPWKAVLTIPRRPLSGPALPQRLVIESSLRGLAVDLPAPLGKRATRRRPLRIETAIAERVAVATRIDYGDTLDVEIDAEKGADGRPRLTRVEALFGATAPEFKATPGVSLGGYVARLPLAEWLGLLGGTPRAAPAPGELRLAQRFDLQVRELDLFGRRFTDTRLRGTRGADSWDIDVTGLDANGRVTLPHDITQGALVLDFERLHLPRVKKPATVPPTPGATAVTAAVPPVVQPAPSSASTLDPRRLPAIQMRCASFRFGEADLGSAEITTTRQPDGQHIDRIRFANPDFQIDAHGDWLTVDAAQGSHFDIDVKSRALGALLQRFGYTAANIRNGRTEITIAANWPGPPTNFTLARMNGHFELHVADGQLLDIEPGGGRLFGLLSLATLPRRLFLDFDDLFQKGFTFDKMDGMFEIDSGNAYTNGLVMEGPAARIDLSGRTGLAAKDYDQHVVVTPALANTLPVAGALFGPIGAGAGAVYFLGQQMFKSLPEQINRLLSREYAITGTWDNPVIERL